MSLGDFALETTIHTKFTTRAFASGVPTTLSGTPVVDIYEDNSLTQITGAETLTVDFDSVTGLNHLAIAATAANGFEAGKFYHAVITTGTVGGVSVVGEVVAEFSIEATAALRPTTAGRTLDVAATGEAGVDLGNVTGTLTQANVGWVDANSRVDVGLMLGQAVTLSSDNRLRVDTAEWNDIPLATTNPLPNAAADAAGGLPISDAGGLDMDSLATGAVSAKYNGPRGPGVFLNTTASNTNTVLGTDGTNGNPVSTLAAAVTLVGSLGEKRIYIVGASTVSLAGQTLADYEFIGQSTFNSAILNLGTAASPSTLSRFRAENLTVYGTHDFTDRINLVNCIIDDAPAAEITKLNVIAVCCALQGDFSLDTSTDNLFDCCYSAVAGNGYPVCNATGAAGTVVFRHYSGGIGFNSLSASHTVSVETDGQVVFESGCNVNAAVSLRGMMTITDNTAGMNSLTTGAAFGPTIGSPAGASVSADIATVDGNVDSVLVDTDTTIPALIAALNDISVADVLTTQMTESYNADGAAPTLAQALHLLIAYLTERSVSGTTVTAKKLDGSTTAATFTLNDGTSPTSITRAT